jgi:two-component system sensor kinase FixL
VRSAPSYSPRCVTDRAREVQIRTQQGGQGAGSIEIEDSGRGLDPDLRARAFRPFYTTKERGMGLGLSICQSIAEAHVGMLSLVAGVKHGAVFRLELFFHTLPQCWRPPKPAPT